MKTLIAGVLAAVAATGVVVAVVQVGDLIPAEPAAELLQPPRSHLRDSSAMGSVRFRAVLVPRGATAAMVIEHEHVAAAGEGARRFPVVATVNGYTWRTTITRMGGEFLLGLNRAVREQAGVQAGDSVDVRPLDRRGKARPNTSAARRSGDRECCEPAGRGPERLRCGPCARGRPGPSR